MTQLGIGGDLHVDRVQGRLMTQLGLLSTTTPRNDASPGRGQWDLADAYRYLSEAYGGYHFGDPHRGVNVQAGIFMSYIGLWSYYNFDNWTYQPSYVSSNTPWFFNGVRAQWFVSDRLKIEPWIVNGWQTFGQWQEGRAGGFLWNWRPSSRLSISSTAYAGQEAPGDSKSSRWYTDNYAEYQFFKGTNLVRSAAIAVVGDLGYDYRSGGARDGVRAGGSLSHRLELRGDVEWTVRGDYYFDESQAIVTSFPITSPYARPDQDRPFSGGGFTTTFDYWPSPWTVLRLEYMHRVANIPFFSGHGGITGPGGVQPSSSADAATFTPALRRSDDRIVVNATLRL